MLFKDFYRYANEGSFPGATRKSKKKTLWISNVWQKLETNLEEKPSIPTVFWKIAFDKGHRRSQVAYGKTGPRKISAIFGYVTLLTIPIKCFKGPEPQTQLPDPYEGHNPSIVMFKFFAPTP